MAKLSTLMNVFSSLKTTFLAVISAGTHARKPSHINLAIKNINLISILIIPCTVIFSVVLILQNREPAIYMPVAIEGALFLSLLYLNKKGFYKLTGYLVAILNCAAITYYSVIFGRITEVYLLFIFVLSVSVLVQVDKKQLVLSMAVTVMTILICAVNYHYQIIEPLINSTDKGLDAALLLLILFLDIAAVLVTRAHIQDLFGTIKQANRELRTTLASLNKSNEILNELVDKLAMQKNELKEFNTLNVLKNEYLQLSNHELRAPLHSISLISQFLYYESISGAENPHLKPHLESLYSASVYVKNLINQNLSFNMIEGGMLAGNKFEVINIRSFLQNIISVHDYPAAAKKVKITSVINSMPEYIKTDINILRCIIANLVSNAIKYTEPDTTIAVDLTGNDTSFSLKVADQGKGIDADKQELIFEEYYTTGMNHINSSGVGLSLTKKAVKQLGGTIRVSNSAKGAVFEVNLPLYVYEGEHKNTSESGDLSLLDLTFPLLKVLVVEDDFVAQFMMETALRKFQCGFTIAPDIRSGLEQIEKVHYDLVILDGILPDGTAEKFLKVLREIMQKDTPVIICSGDNFDETIKRYMDAGANNFLKKPCQISEIAEVLLPYSKRMERYAEPESNPKR